MNYQEEFGDTKGVIRSSNLKKDRHFNYHCLILITW